MRKAIKIVFTFFVFVQIVCCANRAKLNQQQQLQQLQRRQQQQQQQQQQQENEQNIFEVVNEWKYLDFEYPTYVERQAAIANRDFIVSNNLPLGIDYDFVGGRMFITTPRWKDGVPSSLNWLPYPPLERSPALRPYPDWSAHGNPNAPDCTKLISVYRTAIDVRCQRLWLIDSGIVNATIQLNQICPPKIRAYDLRTNALVNDFTIPENFVRQDSLHSNIVVDLRDNEDCNDAHIYVSDVWRYGLLVYSVAKQRAWRVTNYHFAPQPDASDFNVYNLNFQWLDGVFGMSLSHPPPPQQQQQQQYHSLHPQTFYQYQQQQQQQQLQQLQHNDRLLYFHPMASFKEFIVSTALLRNEEIWTSATGAQSYAQHFVAIGDRGGAGQSSTSGITRDGIMFYTLVHRDNVGCWDTAKPYLRRNLMQLLNNNNNSNSKSNNNNTLLQFPNDLKVDDAPEQSVWLLSNRLPIYLYSQLNYDEVNFRILRANVAQAVAGSVCAPQQQQYEQYTPIDDADNGQMFVLLNEGQCY